MNISGKKKNLQVQFTDLQEDMKVPSGGSYKVDIQVPKGVLAGCLYDHDAAECLPNYAYEIYDEEGKKLFEGKTDESGFFRHEDVPEDYYTLKANGEDHALVTIDEDGEPQTIAVLNEKGDADTSDDYDDEDADSSDDDADDDGNNQSDSQDEQSEDEDADSSDDDADDEYNQSDNQDEQSEDKDADSSDDDADDDGNNQSDSQNEQSEDEDADSSDDDEAGNVSHN